MPRRLYDDFMLKRIDLKPCKSGSGQSGERRYAVFGCPHCNEEIEVVESLMHNKKASVCGGHLKSCETYPAKQNESSTSTEKPIPAEDMHRFWEESEVRHQQRHNGIQLACLPAHSNRDADLSHVNGARAPRASPL